MGFKEAFVPIYSSLIAEKAISSILPVHSITDFPNHTVISTAVPYPYQCELCEGPLPGGRWESSISHHLITLDKVIISYQGRQLEDKSQ